MRKFTDVIQDQGGNIVAGAELYVRDQGDNSLVTLYSDDGVTETANPAVSGADGYVTFWTADNTLKFELYVDGELEKTIEQVQHFDLDNITSYVWTLLDDADAATARGTLGLGTISTQAANNVAITGGSIAGITDLAVADGGTGASTAAGARTNLGLVIGTDVLGMGGGTLTGDLSVPDEAYDATSWNGSAEVPTKNAVRDKIESLSSTGGVPVLLETQTPSGAASVDLESFAGGGYALIWIICDLTVSTNGAYMRGLMKFNGSYATSANYNRVGTARSTAGATDTLDTTVGTFLFFSGTAAGFTIGNGAAENYNCDIRLYYPDNATKYKRSRCEAFYSNASGAGALIQAGTSGMFTGTDATMPLQGLRIEPSAGTITGTIKVFGQK